MVNADRPKEHQAGSSAYAATSHVRAISASNASAVPVGDANVLGHQKPFKQLADREGARVTIATSAVLYHGVHREPVDQERPEDLPRPGRVLVVIEFRVQSSVHPRELPGGPVAARSTRRIQSGTATRSARDGVCRVKLRSRQPNRDSDGRFVRRSPGGIPRCPVDLIEARYRAPDRAGSQRTAAS